MPLDDEIIEENPLEGQETVADNPADNPVNSDDPKVNNDDSQVQDSGEGSAAPAEGQPETGSILNDVVEDNIVVDDGEAAVDPDNGEAVPDPDNGEAVPDPDEGEAVPDSDEGEAAADPDEGEAVPDPDNGEAVPDPDEGEAVSDPDEGEAVPDPDEGEAVPDPDDGDSVSLDEAISEIMMQYSLQNNEEESQTVDVYTDLEAFESSTIQVDLYQYTILNRLEFIQYALCIVIALLFLQIFMRYKK